MKKIRISLLPSELKKQSSMMKVWTIMAMVLAIIALVLLAGNILFSFYLESPVAELESLKTENKNITENIGRLSYIREMFDEIENNNNTIKILKGNNPDWQYLLDETTSNAAVYGIRISRFELVASGGEPGCMISGETENIDEIKNWITSFDSKEGIMSTELGNISVSSSGGNTIYRFDLAIGIADWNME